MCKVGLSIQFYELYPALDLGCYLSSISCHAMLVILHLKQQFAVLIVLVHNFVGVSFIIDLLWACFLNPLE